MFVLFLCTSTALAAEKTYPLEPADTSSPRATLHSFISACDEAFRLTREGSRRHYTRAQRKAIAERVLRSLDLSQEAPSLREDVGKEAAVCLKEVLDRIELPPDDEIPGPAADGTEPEEELPARWRIPHTEIKIVRIDEGPRQGEYLFSAETVARAQEFYSLVEHLPYKPGASVGFYEWYLSEPGWMIPRALITGLPEWMRERPFGQAVWQWLGLAIILFIALAVMIVTYRLGRRMADLARKSSALQYCLTLLLPIAAMLVPFVVKYLAAEQLVISGWTLVITKMSADVVFLLALMVVVIGAGNRIAESIISSPRINPKGVDAQLIRLVCRVLTLIAAVIVFLEGGKYLGIPVTTLLAGAGVGGLAFALAAQDTLKNLFGSMMIMLDKPYRVGERILAKGYDGVVEEIGLRSTKIRLLTGHQAAIPNEEMARSDIENVGRRPHIRRITDISLPLDTAPEKAQLAVEIVRGILENHEGMEPDFPPRVYFNDFNRDSLNLRMIYWYHPPAYWDFLAFSQEVNTRIMRQFATQGIRFALPAATTFMAQDRERPLELKVIDQSAPKHEATRNAVHSTDK